MDQLLRPGLQASWFNDDVLGRHLDRQYEVEIHQVYSTFQLQVHQHERIPMGVFHGDYDEHVRLRRIHETEQSADIVEGYSRDRRGAKQIQFGIPLHGDVYDGNTSDKTWLASGRAGETPCAVCHREAEGFLYVAD